MYTALQVNQKLPVIRQRRKPVEASQHLRLLVVGAVASLTHGDVGNAYQHTLRYSAAIRAFTPIYGDAPEPHDILAFCEFRKQYEESHGAGANEPGDDGRPVPPTEECIRAWEDHHGPAICRRHVLPGVPAEADDVDEPSNLLSSLLLPSQESETYRLAQLYVMSLLWRLLGSVDLSLL